MTPAQRVPGPDLVVAVGHHHHRRGGGHPAADEDEQVQGGLVGPVGVLDHRHHRPATGVEQVQERAEQAVPGRLGGDQHQAAVPVPGLGQPPVERPQERPPFQQHHGPDRSAIRLH
jgi:hypothetical protein